MKLFAERYLNAKKLRTWEKTKRLLDRNAVAAWRGRFMAGITKQDVHARLDGRMWERKYLKSRRRL